MVDLNHGPGGVSELQSGVLPSVARQRGLQSAVRNENAYHRQKENARRQGRRPVIRPASENGEAPVSACRSPVAVGGSAGASAARSYELLAEQNGLIDIQTQVA